jgi:hypothetical protein
MRVCACLCVCVCACVCVWTMDYGLWTVDCGLWTAVDDLFLITNANIFPAAGGVYLTSLASYCSIAALQQLQDRAVNRRQFQWQGPEWMMHAHSGSCKKTALASTRIILPILVHLYHLRRLNCILVLLGSTSTLVARVARRTAKRLLVPPVHF